MITWNRLIQVSRCTQEDALSHTHIQLIFQIVPSVFFMGLHFSLSQRDKCKEQFKIESANFLAVWNLINVNELKHIKILYTISILRINATSGGTHTIMTKFLLMRTQMV